MQINRLASYSLIFIALVLLAIVLQTFEAVLRPMAIATLLVFIFTPLAHFAKRRKIPVWLMFVGVSIAVVLVLVVISKLVTADAAELSGAIARYQERLRERSGDLAALGAQFGVGMDSVQPEQLTKLAAQGLGKVVGTARMIFSETLMAMILLMFLVPSRVQLLRFVERRYGEGEIARLRGTFARIEGDVMTYFGTKALISLGTAIGTGIVLLLFGAEFIFVSLLVIFVLNFIPVIGSFIAVAIVMVLYLLAFELSLAALWLFLLLMAVQVFFGSILEPRIAGQRLNMSPILIVLSLYVWGWIWGIIGMLLSVPLTILILIIVKHVGPADESAANEA